MGLFGSGANRSSVQTIEFGSVLEKNKSGVVRYELKPMGAQQFRNCVPNLLVCLGVVDGAVRLLFFSTASRSMPPLPPFDPATSGTSRGSPRTGLLFYF